MFTDDYTESWLYDSRCSYDRETERFSECDGISRCVCRSCRQPKGQPEQPLLDALFAELNKARPDDHAAWKLIETMGELAGGRR